MFRFAKKSTRDTRFFQIGFHGDKYLISIVETIMESVDVFIETGTNVGSTLAYVARTYKHIKCLSCEQQNKLFIKAIKNIKDFTNASVFNESSDDFFNRLKINYKELLNNKILFWLDAHGYGFKWPLKNEIEFITNNLSSAYILIDDFKVPGLDCFGYDEYDGQECSFNFIKNSLNKINNYNLIYPNYANQTSKHHPLRGWGLLEFGNEKQLQIPNNISDKFTFIKYKN